MSGSSSPSSSYYIPDFDYNNYYREVLEQITTNLSNALETFGPASLQYQTILETLRSCLRILDAFETAPASASPSLSQTTCSCSSVVHVPVEDTAAAMEMEIEIETDPSSVRVDGRDQDQGGLSRQQQQQQQQGDGKGEEGGREGKVTTGLDVDPDLLSLAMELLRIGDGMEGHGRREG